MNELKQKIYDEINKSNAVSFVQLQNIAGFRGDRVMTSAQHPRVVYWQGVSQEAADAINELRNEKLIVMEPCEPLCYLIDGEFLKLPLLKSPTKLPKKNDRWLPVTFSAVKRHERR